MTASIRALMFTNQLVNFIHHLNIIINNFVNNNIHNLIYHNHQVAVIVGFVIKLFRLTTNTNNIIGAFIYGFSERGNIA